MHRKYDGILKIVYKIVKSVLCAREVEYGTCDDVVAGGRLELRPPMESSDLDEKVLTTTPVRDTSSVGIWVESLCCILLLNEDFVEAS